VTDGTTEERELGLQRVVVSTPAGPIVARVGRADRGGGVLLIHGAAGSWRGWLPLLRAARRAGRPMADAVAVDLPGWGGSADPVRPLDAARAARAVAVVARAAGLERWTVVGHSLGGMVALALAAQEPAATEAVVLVSPTGPAVLDAIRRPLLGGRRLPWFAGMLLAMRALGALPSGGRPLLRALGRRRVLGRLAAPLLADRHAVDPEVLADFGDEVRPRAFVAATRSTLRSPGPSWEAIRCPVRSLRGRHDVFVGRDDAAWFARTLPDFAETVLPDAGHFALAERPDALLALVDRVRAAG
jgi:pimeloyl-ACP methyl ester carboxylesterase